MSFPSFWTVTDPLSADCFQGPKIGTLECRMGWPRHIWPFGDPPGIWVDSKGVLERLWLDQTLLSLSPQSLSWVCEWQPWVLTWWGFLEASSGWCWVQWGCGNEAPPGEVSLFVCVFFFPTNGLRTIFPGEPLKPAWELTEGARSGFQSHNCYNTEITHGFP